MKIFIGVFAMCSVWEDLNFLDRLVIWEYLYFMTTLFKSRHLSHPLAQMQGYQLEWEQKIAGAPLFPADNNKSSHLAAHVVGSLSGLMQNERRLDVQKRICTRAFIAAVGFSTAHNIDLAVKCVHPSRGYMDQRLDRYCQRRAARYRRQKITREKFEHFARNTLSQWASELSLGALSVQDQKLYALVRDVRKDKGEIDARNFVDQSTITAVQNLCVIFGMLQVPDLQVPIKGVKYPSFDPEQFYKKELDDYLQDSRVRSIFAAMP